MASSRYKRLVASLVWCKRILLVSIRSAFSKLRAFIAYFARERHFWASSAFMFICNVMGFGQIILLFSIVPLNLCFDY